MCMAHGSRFMPWEIGMFLNRGVESVHGAWDLGSAAVSKGVLPMGWLSVLGGLSGAGSKGWNVILPFLTAKDSRPIFSQYLIQGLGFRV